MYVRNVAIFNTGETHILTFKTAEYAGRELNFMKSEYLCYHDGKYDRTLSHTGLAIMLEQRLKNGYDSDLDGWSAVHTHWNEDKTQVLYIETFQTLWGDP